MKIPCSYHPKEPAQWFCPSCSSTLCDSCSTKKRLNGYSFTDDLRLCSKCSYPLEQNFIAPEILPIRKVLFSALAYPIKPGPFFLGLLLSVLAFVAFKLTAFGILIVLGLWAIWLKYSISAMLETAQGKMTPPDLQKEPAAGEFLMLLKQLLILYPLIFFGYFIYRYAGSTSATLFFMLLAFVLPAMLGVLVINDSILQALNLFQAVRISLKTGLPYLLMCLFIVGIVGSASALTMHIFQYVPEDRFVFLSVMLTNYFTLFIYHLIGYMIYKNQDKLGFESVYSREYSPEIKTAPVRQALRPLFNNLNNLIKAGNIEEAVQLVRDNIRCIHESQVICERFYILLKMLGLKDDIIMHAPVYMKHLNTSNTLDKLLEVYQECVQINSAFCPERDVALKTANLLIANSRHSDALELLEKYLSSTSYEGSNAKVYLQAAQIALVNQQDSPKAIELLEAMVRLFPLDELTPYAKTILKDISGKNALSL